MEGGNDVQRLLSQNKQATITKTLGLLNQDLHLRELYCPEVLYVPDRGKKVSKFSDDTDLCEFWLTTGTFYIVQKKTIQTAH